MPHDHIILPAKEGDPAACAAPRSSKGFNQVGPLCRELIKRAFQQYTQAGSLFLLDIGSLGGTLGNPTSFNTRGQVVGISNMAGDLTSHPFLWSKKKGLQDLGTLGGDNGVANWINDTGDIAGKADLPGPAPQNHDAVLWRKNGAEMIDLGVLPGDSCANAYYVNSRGQVVGTSENSDLCRIPTIPVGERRADD